MTKSEPRGYTTVVVRRIQEADPTLPAVQLALLCIKHDIPMAHVAESLGVTRMTVYNWFTNKFAPRKHQLVKILDIIERLN